MSDNLKIYNQVRTVPENAQKQIQAGRLKGMTDINPMWRIKTLTEVFGPCGIGWYIDGVEFKEYTANEEVVVMCRGHLIVADPENGQWSMPIFGTGGSKLIVKESKGLYVDDEAYKKAYTDMIGVACKALGIGADVYWNKDRTKYITDSQPENPVPEYISEDGVKTITNLLSVRKKSNPEKTGAFYKYLQMKYKFNEMSEIKGEHYRAILNEITKFNPSEEAVQ